MQRPFRAIMMVGLVFFFVTGFTGALEITLASPLPQNSPWGIILDRISAEWRQVTNGEVTLNVLHQRAGTEQQYLTGLKQNRFQAVVLTSEAFFSIAPEIMALSIPFLIRNDAEFDAVLQEVRPTLDTRIEEEGYKVLAWVKGGWVKIFSRSPIVTPDDLKKNKLAVSSGNNKLSNAFKSMGFQVVEASMTDIASFLPTGKIDAFYQSPILVQASQSYQYAKNMCSFSLAPFMGGVLMSKRGWERIPQQYQARLQEIVRRAGIEFEQSFQRQEVEAIALMRRDGLNYVEANPQMEQLWRNTMEPQIAVMVDKNIFHKGMYERILTILRRIRGAR